MKLMTDKIQNCSIYKNVSIHQTILCYTRILLHFNFSKYKFIHLKIKTQKIFLMHQNYFAQEKHF